MASQAVIDLPEPKKTSDAASKKYVDDLMADNVGVGNMNGGGSPFFKEKGNYQATHAINMAFKKLLNLSTPSELYEAATKEYVDQRPHIIAVHANCYGPLRKGGYHFAFGGSVIDPAGSTGFLVPQSARIKKVQLKTLYRGYIVENSDIVGPLFTIIAGKDRYEVTNLRIYECTKISEDPRIIIMK